MCPMLANKEYNDHYYRHDYLRIRRISEVKKTTKTETLVSGASSAVFQHGSALLAGDNRR